MTQPSPARTHMVEVRFRHMCPSPNHSLTSRPPNGIGQNWSADGWRISISPPNTRHRVPTRGIVVKLLFCLGGKLHRRVHNSHLIHQELWCQPPLLLPPLPPQSNKFPHPPNQIIVFGMSCGIVVFRPTRSRRWLGVGCCPQSSLTRTTVGAIVAACSFVATCVSSHSVPAKVKKILWGSNLVPLQLP